MQELASQTSNNHLTIVRKSYTIELANLTSQLHENCPHPWRYHQRSNPTDGGQELGTLKHAGQIKRPDRHVGQSLDNMGLTYVKVGVQ